SIAPSILSQGPWGLSWLRPQALMGLGLDPISHGTVWSLAANVLVFVLGSLLSRQGLIERLQAAAFVDGAPGNAD
ncbi:hypothetical protein, partial [Klebsiella pneumoniae]|uniref:hypothetical protein n=1 Tax=Klebsiella pneumoniae TaxID=573 RepID=UPI0013D5604A